MTPSFADSDNMRHLEHRPRNGAIELHAQAIVNDSVDRPPVLLLSEAEAPSSRWPTELLMGLAERSGGVIWFDTRDIGTSTWVDDPYTLEDLANDALAVLDDFEIPVAHVLGRSMGGQIAQRLALSEPERIASITLLSTTPGRRETYGMPAEWLIDKMTERLFGDPPIDPAGRAEWLVDQLEWFSGPVFAFDRPAAVRAATAEVESGWRGPNGHGQAVVEATDLVDRLRDIGQPALVLHGTADPVFPVAHGQALGELLGNATVVLFEGLGHELPVSLVPEIIRHIDSYCLADHAEN